MPTLIHLYRAPYSTNCQRVTLALAHKGLDHDAVWIDYRDRSVVQKVSGQELVPVIEDGGTVVVDSTRILEHLERRFPSPALYPTQSARRAEMEIFIDWFNHVWKAWPNQIEAELGESRHRQERIESASAQMDAALDRFDAMLGGRAFLMGDEPTAADFAVYPFVKYARDRDRDDDELFHRILDDHQSVEGRLQLAGWIEQMGNLPGGDLVPT